MHLLFVARTSVAFDFTSKILFNEQEELPLGAYNEIKSDFSASSDHKLNEDVIDAI